MEQTSKSPSTDLFHGMNFIGGEGKSTTRDTEAVFGTEAHDNGDYGQIPSGDKKCGLCQTGAGLYMWGRLGPV